MTNSTKGGTYWCGLMGSLILHQSEKSRQETKHYRQKKKEHIWNNRVFITFCPAYRFMYTYGHIIFIFVFLHKIRDREKKNQAINYSLGSIADN